MIASTRLPDDERLRTASGRLGDYLRYTLGQGAAFARRLHAEELTPEHVLAALLRDEECGATRLVLHAFADPATIGIEVTALCPGIMVVRSEGSLPFSVRGVEALEEARRLAVQRAAGAVEVHDVAQAAWNALPEEIQERLGPLPPPPASTEREPIDAEGPLFATFTADARRAIGHAAREAAERRRSAISPAHLLAGVLATDAPLRERSGWTVSRVRLALAGADEDTTPLPNRLLGVDGRLHELLEGLIPGAGTAALLGAFLAHGSEEVRSLLRRQKITDALYQRAGGSFEDPERPPPEDPPAAGAP